MTTPSLPPADPMVDTAATVEALTRADGAEVLAVDDWAFGTDGDTLLGADREAVLDVLDWQRTYGVRSGTPPRLCAVHSVVPGRLGVPGGRRLPAAGLAWVGVHPGQRRRGLLTTMLRFHLDDAAAHGEPVSLLYAAEAAIYGRFGYAANPALRLSLPRGAVLRPVPGADTLVTDLDDADADRHLALVAGCLDAALRRRPGGLTRQAPGRRRGAFLDPPHRRRGAERLRLLTVSTPEGEVRGYALFRRRPGWQDEQPTGTVDVREAVALDGAASRALWSRLVDLDLTSRVDTPLLAPDDPLTVLLLDPRAARPRWTDGVWARLVDVPAALSARGYGADVDVVLAVTDTLRPGNAGRWRLRAGPAGATCARTDAPAQLHLDVRELAAAYLGGTSLRALATAGLVRADDDVALTAASLAFGTPLAPHCPWAF